MQYMPRDIRLIRQMNGAGALTTMQVTAELGIDTSTARRRLRKLRAAHLVTQIDVPFLMSKPYAPTIDGCLLAEDPLPPIKTIRAAEWRHDSLLVDVLRALKLLVGGTVEPARRIRFRLANQTPFHLPDAYVWRQGKKPFAVELELTRKSIERLSKILDEYRSDTKIAGVLYVTGDPKIARFVQNVSDGDRFVRIALLSELLSRANATPPDRHCSTAASHA